MLMISFLSNQEKYISHRVAKFAVATQKLRKKYVNDNVVNCGDTHMN